MELITSNAELIEESNPYKKVELIGRTCYKSEDKITESSCYSFVHGLIQRQHYAMLEHARFTFILNGVDIPLEHLCSVPAIQYKVLNKKSGIAALNVSMSHLYNKQWYSYRNLRHLLVNFKNIVESTYLPNHAECAHDDRIYLIDTKFCPNISDYKTIKFICDRGISHELARHRCAVAQESTRYCNYIKDKFGNGSIQFIIPSTYQSWSENSKKSFENVLYSSECTYNRMILDGLEPQQARAVLPNALKTEIILTMSLDQWKHFFDLRYFGTTGKPHPDMQYIASMAYTLLNS